MGNQLYFWEDISLKSCTPQALFEKIVQLELDFKEQLLTCHTQDEFLQEYKKFHTIWVSFSPQISLQKEKFQFAYFIYVRSFFYENQESFFVSNYKTPIEYEEENPKITVLIPTYQGEKYLWETLISLLKQTYKNFEILVIDELESGEEVHRIITLFQDKRIRFMKNKTHLGLSNTLNIGMIKGKGDYIARADADDLYDSTRLEKQLAFLENHKDISLCGSWQKHFGKEIQFIHKPPISHNQIKANLLFGCDLCHSTLMLRQKDFLNENLMYDERYLSEDFELWTRAVFTLNFANLPEVLGEYRLTGHSITNQKESKMDLDSMKIIAKTLNNALGISIPVEKYMLLCTRTNLFSYGTFLQDEALLRQGKELLDFILNTNLEKKAYHQEALGQALGRRWLWMHGIDVWRLELGDTDYSRIISGELELTMWIKKNNQLYYPTLASKMKRRIKRFIKPVYRKIHENIKKEFILTHNILQNEEKINPEI